MCFQIGFMCFVAVKICIHFEIVLKLQTIRLFARSFVCFV